jgi:putative autoinducer-2 (AI-2) aldolase
MPEADANSEAKFSNSQPLATSSDLHVLKGSQHLSWGMKDRLNRIFNPKTGRAVILAFDHGYAMGPTSGLEVLETAIPSLIEHVDCLMCTRGALRAAVPPTCNKPISLRVTAGNSILNERLFESECIGVNIEDAIRLNASAMAVQVCIGADNEVPTIKNLVNVVDAGMRYGIPTLGVTAVGRQLTRDARYLGLATRMLAELGAQIVKTYYCDEGFENVVAGCPAPIVIAGGKKVPVRDALELCYRAINAGAAGVDMGRNIFQAEDPAAIAQAVVAIVHENASVDAAYEMFNDLKADNAKA